VPPSAALLRALAANPELMADLIAALNMPVPDADALIDLMARTSRQAVHLLRDVDWAGVTAQFDGQKPFTAAHTDEKVLIVDERQYKVHDGPCLQAMRTDRRTRLTLAQVTARWPQLGDAAADVGVHSFLALPLHAQDSSPLGSLNLYSAAVDALNTPDEDLLTVLTEYLERGLQSYRRYQPAFGAADLRAALDRRRLIEQAIGVLMASHQLDQYEARELLQQQADTEELEVIEQARRIIDHHLPSPD